ncbi:MAG: PqqD family protein [Telluria sp.]|nr:PqqD family protein [Telluria sp.]
MNLHSKITVPEHVLARQVADETVILDLDNGHYYGLDHVGVRMWELLGSRMTLGEVCETLAREYDVSPEKLEQDLFALVQSLADAKLVTIK